MVLSTDDNTQPGSSESDGPGFLQSEIFSAPGLVHGFFNRHGGVSEAPFSALNVSLGVGDHPSAVIENRLGLKRALGIEVLVSARQVHGSKVMVISDIPDGDLEGDGYDALVTDQPIGLMIQQADCQAVILYDPVRKVVGAVHVGWRGSVAGVIDETVKTMVDNFATDPADLLAAVSPSLGPCCAEFVNYRQEFPEWMQRFQVRPDYFDFWKSSHFQLQEAGLTAANIAVVGICTCCNKEYFSYRRSRVTGRCATIIGLFPHRGQCQSSAGFVC